jgi:hypothetical protein
VKNHCAPVHSGFRFLVLLLAIAGFATTAWAQGSFGGLTGGITDPGGATVGDVQITVINIDTGATSLVTSTADGTYVAPSLVPGKYRVSATKSGFKTVTQEGVTVSTATVTALDFALTIGTVGEIVNVASDAPHLETTSAEIGTVMPSKELLDLPISLGGAATTGASGRRQIQNFIYLTPGVTGDQWGTSINGAPGMSAQVIVDGVDMQNIGASGFIAESAPPYESVSEFKVQNTLYPAQYGQGYGVMNFTMRSGTNRFHGDLFEFFRNDKLDAAGYFSAGKNAIRQNEFGGTIGGPVLLPWYNGKDKTHFFFAWSGFRLSGGLPHAGLVTLPTLAERTGDFSDYPLPIYDPATTRPDGSGGFIRDQFPNNIIPPDRISGVAQRLIALLPPPDTSATFFNYVDRSSSPSSDDDWSVKVDHQLTSKQYLSGAFWRVNARTTINGPVAGELNPGLRVTPTSSYGVRVNHVWTLGGNLVNHAAVGVTHVIPTWATFLLDPRLGNQTLQIPGIPQDSHGFTEFHFGTGPGSVLQGGADYPFLGNSANQGYDPQLFINWVASDDVSWVKGRHQIEFGFEARRRTIAAHDQTLDAGSLTFNSNSTDLPDSPNFGSNGNSFASMMLGQVFSGIRAVPLPEQHFHDSMLAAYVQDLVKLTPKLSLSLGLRYEFPVYAVEDDGQMGLFNPTRPNPAAGNLPGALEFLGKGAGRTGTYNIFGTYTKSFSPRVSLTYQLNDKTVIRTGYGIFRLYPNYGDLNNPNALVFAPGFGATLSTSSTNQGITPAFNLDAGFPAQNITLPNFDPSQNNGGTVTYINSRSNRPAFMQSWTLDVQHNLPWAIMLDVAYVGSHATGIWSGVENINQVNPKHLSLGSTLDADINSPEAAAAGITPPYPGFQGSVAQALRPFPQYTTINDFYQPTGYNVYHSMQVRAQKRYANGLSFLGAYTLSKNIGIEPANTFGSWFGAAAQTSLNTFNQAAEKSLVGTDRTHVFILSWTYELPFGRSKRYLGGINPVLNQIIGGWQINAIQTYESGTPIAVSGGGNLSIFGGGNRPDQVSNNVRSNVSMSDFNPATDVYLNINAFAQPAPFTFGNAPALLPNVRTPANYNEDISIFKSFSFWRESTNLEFRAEMFNAFNRTNFAGPAADVNTPDTFGHIFAQANTPRVIQLALKLNF